MQIGTNFGKAFYVLETFFCKSLGIWGICAAVRALRHFFVRVLFIFTASLKALFSLFSSSYVRFDIIRRILTRFFETEVIMVMGITDIDDKIIRRANEVGIYHSLRPNCLVCPTASYIGKCSTFV